MSYWHRKEDADSGLLVEQIEVLGDIKAAIIHNNIELLCDSLNTIVSLEPIFDLHIETQLRMVSNFRHLKLLTIIINGGELKHVKLAIDSGCLFNQETCMRAAQFGKLDILQYLKELECPWDDRTTSICIWEDEIDCLEYCIDNKCPMVNHGLSLCFKKYKSDYSPHGPNYRKFRTFAALKFLLKSEYSQRVLDLAKLQNKLVIDSATDIINNHTL